ncbi:hypothetical protein K440DRAFT_633188 [Wilcoxina mikolae CBS 423.85]|nr:hypothetical protein K440DRAFT_633188 [Wilcoxina mikolae CBS 423.85]
MQELANWRPEAASTHAVNISNTPLVPRPLPHSVSDKIANLLICHDFKGSYHPTEAAQGLFTPAGSEQESVYTAEYLHYATTFTYFSHKRVSIPPAAWINVCHRSGVRVLGTFLVEHIEGSSEAGRLFEKGSEGEYLFATQLARIRETYGFDGWLLNIESSFPHPWSPLELQRWIKELKAAGGEVVWYDAVTVLNQVHWQNGLTLLNAPFLYVSDGIFLNYGWREREIVGTKRIGDVMGRGNDLWMGIDCHGRGSLGDGGFGVTIALDEIQKHGLAAAMFAPGWTWENFQGKGFHEVERKFWVGDGTPQAPGVAKCVTNKPVGTSSFFYTSFNRGFGQGFWLRGKKLTEANWVHLGAQSILPNHHSSLKSYDSTKAFTGAWSLKIIFPPSPSIQYTPLYSVGIKFVPDLVLQYVFQTPTSGVAGLYWDFLSQSGTKERRMEAFEGPCAGWKSGSVLAGDEDVDGSTITEVGVYCSPSSSSSVSSEMWLGELIFTTLDDSEDGQHPSKITSVVFRPGEAGGSAKVTWNVYPSFADDGVVKKRTRAGMWSDQTMDYAYFIVWKGSKMMGVAYACEFVVKGKDDGDGWRVSGVTWEGAVFEGDEAH